MMKRAIVYYSLTDNTKEAAEIIAKDLGVDLYRIDTVKPMPKDKDKQMMYGGMQAVFGMCPDIKGIPDDIQYFDNIIIGTPIWAGKIAPAINTLLKSYEIREKVTAVFTFSGGGDNDKCIARLQKKLPNLTNTVALADRNNKIASENMNKINSFIKELSNENR